MVKRKIWMSMAAGVAALGLALTGATVAQAGTIYKIVNVQKFTGQVGSQVIGSCLIRSSGGTCTVTKGKSASRDIQLSLGVTRGTVASGLSISSGSSVSTSVSCTSPALPANTTWKARSMGTKYFYNVRRTEGSGATVRVTTSAQIMAFNPYATQIACGTR